MRRGSSSCALRVAPGGQPWRGNFGGGNSKEQPWQATMAGAWRGATLACGGKPGGGTGTTLTGPANGRANRGKLAEASLALGGGAACISAQEGGICSPYMRGFQGSDLRRRHLFKVPELRGGIRSTCMKGSGAQTCPEFATKKKGSGAQTCLGGICSTCMKGFQSSPVQEEFVLPI